MVMMRDEEDVPGTCVDLAPPRVRYSLGFNPMSWTVGACLVVLVQFLVIAVLVGALLGMVRW